MLKIFTLLFSCLVFLYLAACAYIYTIQEQFIFFPSREIRTLPRDTNLQNITINTPDGENLNAWFIDNKSPVTILFFHGNGGNIFFNQERITLFNMIGVNALLLDYRGYGKSSGFIKSENDIYTDAESAYQYLLNQGIKPSNIIIWGQSLGGAVAVHAAQFKDIKGLILESTFSSMQELASEQFSYFPVSILLSYKFDSIAKIPNIRVPTLVIHSSTDEMIDKKYGQKIFDVLSVKKDFLFTNGSHNGAFSQSFAQYNDAVGQFIAK